MGEDSALSVVNESGILPSICGIWPPVKVKYRRMASTLAWRGASSFLRRILDHICFLSSQLCSCVPCESLLTAIEPELWNVIV